MYDIVTNRLGGQLNVDPGGGTKIQIILPLRDGGHAHHARVTNAPLSVGLGTC
jgi:hypothetical protein